MSKTSKKKFRASRPAAVPPAAPSLPPRDFSVPYAAGFILSAALFGLVPDTFANHAWDYLQFLPAGWLLFPAALVAVLFLSRKRLAAASSVPPAVHWAAALAVSACFVLFRTRIHCFGGDGNVSPLLPPGFALSDFLPPPPGRGRFDGWLRPAIEKACGALGLFEKSEVMPSMLAAAVHSVVFGVLFVWTAAVVLRRRTDLFLLLATGPFVFNFCGNVDSYAVSLVVALAFFLACRPLWRAGRPVRSRDLALLALLWAFGLWTHPFHAFGGFPLAVLAARRLERFPRAARLPGWLFPVLWGVAFFTAVKCSKWGNAWVEWKFAAPPPTFSRDTLTHYANSILLPVLPLAGVLACDPSRRRRLREPAVLFLSESLVFFAMAFTLGAADQFNYFHLAFFFSVPWWLSLSADRPLPPGPLAAVLACRLFLLVPMAAVHSSHATIRRAGALYPLDPCHHNRVMSWQTHLGLCLADNLQGDPAIRSAVLAAFADGARNARPAGFRFGNAVYHAAFLYEYGEFEAGRRELHALLDAAPEAIRWFLSPRPAFIQCNRERLWGDIDRFLEERRSPVLAEYRGVVAQLREAAAAAPDFVRPPPYARGP